MYSEALTILSCATVLIGVTMGEADDVFMGRYSWPEVFVSSAVLGNAWGALLFVLFN